MEEQTLCRTIKVCAFGVCTGVDGMQVLFISCVDVFLTFFGGSDLLDGVFFHS